jgi:hypothetical protein
MSARAPFPSTTMLLVLLLGGCAGSVKSYPSLAPRPIEQSGATAPAGPPQAAPLDPTVLARAAALVAAARRGAAASDVAARAGCGAIERGLKAAEGSEAWVAAQQSLSAIEAEQSPIAAALDDLDALVLEQAKLAQESPTSVDLAPLTDAAGEVGALDIAQRDRLREVREKGCRP